MLELHAAAGGAQMILEQWAQRWCIGPDALADLRRRLGAQNTGLPAGGFGTGSEARVQNLVRLEASRAGARLWRNNVGAYHTDDGRFVRYGLANESPAMNESFKSSDLIGLRPVVITEAHVGSVLGQFLAREIKHEGWRYSGDNHEKAQLNFLQLVAALGGDAAFANSEGTI